MHVTVSYPQTTRIHYRPLPTTAHSHPQPPTMSRQPPRRITLGDVRRGRHVRVLSIDPGARRPGFACVECWWGSGTTWPCVKPLLLMGDPVISSDVHSVKKFGRIKCVDALDDFFQTHGRELFAHKPDFTIIETQKGVNNRLIDSLSMVMYVTCRHAHKLFPEFCGTAMRVSMCPATWKTQGLGVPPGAQHYNARKRACVKKTHELLRANGFPRTAANIATDEAKRDISDAFMQAVQFFMHTFPKGPVPRPRPRKCATKRKNVAAGSDVPRGPRKPKRRRRAEPVIDLTCSGSECEQGGGGTEEEEESVMAVELEGGMRIRCGVLAAVERLQHAVQAQGRSVPRDTGATGHAQTGPSSRASG